MNELLTGIGTTWDNLVLQTQLDWCVGVTLSLVLIIASSYTIKRIFAGDWGDLEDPTPTGIAGMSAGGVLAISLVVFIIHLFLITNIITPEAATIRRLLGMLG